MYSPHLSDMLPEWALTSSDWMDGWMDVWNSGQRPGLALTSSDCAVTSPVWAPCTPSTAPPTSFRSATDERPTGSEIKLRPSLSVTLPDWASGVAHPSHHLSGRGFSFYASPLFGNQIDSKTSP